MGFFKETVKKDGELLKREAGEGCSDIPVEPDTGDMGMIIEGKYARDGDMDTVCRKALEQIRDTGCEAELRDDGVEHILKYGIACYKKRCRAVSEQAGVAEEKM